MKGYWVVPVIASILILGLILFNEAFAVTEDTKLTVSGPADRDEFGNSVSISGDTAIVGAELDDDDPCIADPFCESGSAYVFTRSGTTWTQQTKLTASDAAADDRFGVSVSISGDTAIVGARGNDDAGTNSGSAYVFTRSGTTWTQQAKLTASDAAAGDFFGFSVSISGDTAIVGASVGDTIGFGSAYVFVKPAGGWADSTQTAKLTASDAAAGDRFGFSVSISGETAIVGAPDDDNVGFDSGSAYVFEEPIGGWVDATEDAKLTALDAAASDFFGVSVSISGDTAIVGARGNDDAGFQSGSAYVFVKPGTGWVDATEDAKLTASDAATGDEFGNSVSISGDTAIVGARFDDDACLPTINQFCNSGSAYVFTRSGTTWTQQAKLTASDAATGDQFGFSVSISGETAIVGADLDDDAGFDSGSAYVFTRSGTTWTEQAKFTASDAATGDQFGISVSISGDTAIVGAVFNDDAGSRSGSAYVFTRSGTTWTQQDKLTALDAAADDFFGISVSISGDTAIVGAVFNDDAGSASGSAYVFTRSGTTWTQQAKLTASDAAADDFFGDSVSISGDTTIVGARFNDDVATNSGSAYVFVKPGTGWVDATEDAKLTASDAAADDQFGNSVSISGDTAIVGARFNDDVPNNSGSAYVFVKPGTGWVDATEDAKLTALDAAADDEFGFSVSISGDTTIVGAVLGDDVPNNSGSAYVFTRSGTTWTQQAELTASDAAADDFFGLSVSISGNTAIVGAVFNDDAGSASGSAYVFTRSGTTWTEQAKLTASDAAAGDALGISASISGDTAIVGANLNDDAGSGSGSAYVFDDFNPPVVTPPADITAEATSALGAAVSYSGESAVDNVDGAIAASCTPASGGTFALGPNTVTCTATDAAGNVGTATFTVTVQDTTPPTISGTPADITAEATSAGGAVVTYTNPTASDTVDPAPTVTCSPTSGTTFTITTTPVTCTATDASGNSAQSTFNVTVQDTTQSLISLINGAGCVNKSGVANALVAKASAAQDAIDRGNIKAATNILEALKHQVEAQSGKGIDTSCANDLLTAATAIINNLTTSTTPNPIIGFVVSASGSAISGATLSLLDSGGNSLATETTDITGFYYFATSYDLTSGSTYTVTVTGLPTGFTTSSPASQTFTWLESAITLSNFVLS